MPKERRGLPLVLFIGALMLAEITCSLESSMIFVALSPLYAVYGNPIRVGWLVTAFTLSAGASAAIGGWLGDLYGRRRMLVVIRSLGVAVGAQTVAMCLATSLVDRGRAARYPAQEAYTLRYFVIAGCAAAWLMLLAIPKRGPIRPDWL